MSPHSPEAKAVIAILAGGEDHAVDDYTAFETCVICGDWKSVGVMTTASECYECLDREAEDDD